VVKTQMEDSKAVERKLVVYGQHVHRALQVIANL
jgi:hypothetical protein